MTRVLVIGGTQFIGRAMVDQLLARGDDVSIMHRGSGTPFGDRVREIRCDRNDVAAVRSTLDGESFELVFDNVYDWQRGTTGDQVRASARAVTSPALRRYVFTSSIAAYGGGLDHTETDDLAPADHPNAYAAHKAESERVLFGLQKTEGIPVTTLRPAFVYGPHNGFEREAWFWDRIVADRPVIVPGDGSRLMQFVHAEDVARVGLAAAGRSASVGAAYGLGCSPPISQEELVQRLARAAGKSVRIVHVPRERLEAAGGQLFASPLYFGAFLDPPPMTAKGDRVRDELGIELIPLDEGFRQTFEWYLTQGRPRPDFSWEDQFVQ
jgi:nucleoside-diphosphate-sugar epimerase